MEWFVLDCKVPDPLSERVWLARLAIVSKGKGAGSRKFFDPLVYYLPMPVYALGPAALSIMYWPFTQKLGEGVWSTLHIN
jgi:hypothetical protein